MEQRITLNSGKILKIQRPSFKDTKQLLRALLREVQTAGVKIDDGMLFSGKLSNVDVSDLFKGDQSILETLLNSVIGMVSSEDLENAIFKCAERSTWNDEKITPDLFDQDEEVVKDYFEICFHIIKESLSPFFGSLGTLSNIIKKKTKSSKAPLQE